jgi:hypothetical protein
MSNVIASWLYSNTVLNQDANYIWHRLESLAQTPHKMRGRGEVNEIKVWGITEKIIEDHQHCFVNASSDLCYLLLSSFFTCFTQISITIHIQSFFLISASTKIKSGARRKTAPQVKTSIIPAQIQTWGCSSSENFFSTAFRRVAATANRWSWLLALCFASVVNFPGLKVRGFGASYADCSSL